MTFEFTKRSQIWYFFPSLNNPIEWVRSGSFLQKVKLREVNWLELMRRGVRTRPNSKSHVHSATPPSSLTSLPFRSLTAGGLTSLAGGPADWTTYGDSPGHINQFFSWLSHLLTVRPWPTHGNFVRAFSFLKLGKRSKVRVNMLLNTHVVGGSIISVIVTTATTTTIHSVPTTCLHCSQLLTCDNSFYSHNNRK